MTDALWTSKEQEQLRFCLRSNLFFIIEQLESALSLPSDQSTAVDVAMGAIPLVQSQLAKDQYMKARLAFGLREYFFGNCSENWAELTKMQHSGFADEARRIIDVIRACFEGMESFPPPEETPSAT
jgi:hypothetical protein